MGSATAYDAYRLLFVRKGLAGRRGTLSTWCVNIRRRWLVSSGVKLLLENLFTCSAHDCRLPGARQGSACLPYGAHVTAAFSSNACGLVVCSAVMLLRLSKDSKPQVTRSNQNRNASHQDNRDAPSYYKCQSETTYHGGSNCKQCAGHNARECRKIASVRIYASHQFVE